MKARGGSTHSDPVILIVNLHFVFFPVDGGFGVASWRDALEDRRLTCCYHHIGGVLSEVISQHCRKRSRKRSGSVESHSMLRLIKEAYRVGINSREACLCACNCANQGLSGGGRTNRERVPLFFNVNIDTHTREKRNKQTSSFADSLIRNLTTCTDPDRQTLQVVVHTAPEPCCTPVQNPGDTTR